MHSNPEHQRLQQDKLQQKNWRKWGPYLSERQWGTVREDYSADGSAWDHFPHDHARSRAYRWGEDGIAGISDDQQLLCFSLALWNGKDSILKERLFGLTGPEGNHGEDVKELYYYLDATPTHSYLKMLYKYPQAEYPYQNLVEENRRRSKQDPEYELLGTGVFNDNKYFDIFIEYAKADENDILIKITAHNRAKEKSTLHLLPQLFFRNTWSWNKDSHRPTIDSPTHGELRAQHPYLGDYRLYWENGGRPLFTENNSNITRLYNQQAPGQHFKDAFHNHIIQHDENALNITPSGTKSALHYRIEIPANSSHTLRLRLTSAAPQPTSPQKSLGSAELGRGAVSRTNSHPFADFNDIFNNRIKEADIFYSNLNPQPKTPNPDSANVQRHAYAGMIWSKQFFYFDIPQWLSGDPNQPAPPQQRKSGRNNEWSHLNNADVISMPDKWEYPWYAAWDLAFHAVAFAPIDPEFAKSQLLLLTREWYMHPNGQLPAYEWALGDVNPPVHAWATWKVYELDRAQRLPSPSSLRRSVASSPFSPSCLSASVPSCLSSPPGDLPFLEKIFHKLLLNFTWWVNRKDTQGRNIFQGGFLGLDNIGVFDRSAPLPTGGFISQCDGTSWMAMYSLNMMRIALELAQHNPVYQDVATKFFEHFLHIAAAMTNIGGEGIDLWDSTEEFFYDVLCLPSGHSTPLKIRSMVGLIPLFAVEILDANLLKKVPEFTNRLEWFLNYRPDLANLVSRWKDPGMHDTHLLSLLRGHRMKALLKRMLDETEFLSTYGVRALSKIHKDHPYQYHVNGTTLSVDYQPGESDSALFGGNSNWRGPIWLPVNYLLIESLRKFHAYYGPDFKVECPTNSGNYLTIEQVANELSRRLTSIVLKDETGHRPVNGTGNSQLATDNFFNDHILFHEYFHGDSGRGVGASHQTGWTGLLALLLNPTETPQPTPVKRQSQKPEPVLIA